MFKLNQVLEQYFLPDNYERSKVYNLLEHHKMRSFFTKNAITKEFSQFAKETYGFP